LQPGGADRRLSAYNRHEPAGGATRASRVGGDARRGARQAQQAQLLPVPAKVGRAQRSARHAGALAAVRPEAFVERSTNPALLPAHRRAHRSHARLEGLPDGSPARWVALDRDSPAESERCPGEARAEASEDDVITLVYAP